MNAYINKWNYMSVRERMTIAILQTHDVFEHDTT